MRRAWPFLVIALALNGCIKRFHMPSSSMAPTIPPGSHVNVDLQAYGKVDPSRFDIVVFIPPQDRSVFFVFRVIGLPGERIVLDTNGVLTDGKPVVSPEGIKYRALGRFADQTTSDVTLGQGEYFLLGDNVENARDSRFFGAVSRQDIIGKVIRIEPPGGP